ncbi:hypothetical protein QR98_0024830 [Sarcoptes scabiei]|uniref:Uncharacterized protein n=1 Tax=Sarcoptes scabiei TaxID=52283 RepID=A0A131ZZD0_SARSC|nr:hypothetical protein QR98_0024830 [Sarcoptes scabiei]
MNKKFIAEDKFLPNHSLKQSICDEEIDDIDNDVGSKDPDQNVNPNKMKLKSSGPKLIELISNLATKSSFRNRSIRKSDSDASTFYNRHNPLKRSQITESILANDLKQQRKCGKISSSISLFGSEIILLSDNECINENRNGKFVCGSRNEMRSRQSSFENNDSSMFSTNQIFPRPHVYLPNASIEESYHRSNSCQQLSLINGETDHFHNHLFVKHLNGENSSNSNNHLGCEFIRNAISCGGANLCFPTGRRRRF